MNPAEENLPPHSMDAEASVIGCILQAPEDCLLECAERLREDGTDFYDLRFRTIYLALLAMSEKDTKIDVVTLKQWLEDHGALGKVGGYAALSSLADNGAAPVLSSYLEIVTEKSSLRRMLTAIGKARGLLEDPRDDVAGTLNQVEQVILDANAREELGVVVSMRERVADAIDVIESAFEHRNKGLQTGIQTGFSYLDKKTTGLHAGQLWLVGGRPGTGKTSWVVTLILNLALRMKKKVGFLSLEMSAEEITMRMICNESKSNMRQLHSGMISERDKTALITTAPAVSGAPVWIDDTPALTPQGLRVHGRRLVQRHGVEVLCIDHLSEVSDPIHRGDEQKDAKAAVVAARWLSRTLKIPVVALVQLNREFEKDKGRRPPRASDLRGHGANEQMADVIAILHRDYGREKEENQDYDENADVWLNTMEICKQRNGPTGPVHFVFDRPSMRYVDATYNTGDMDRGEAKFANEYEEPL